MKPTQYQVSLTTGLSWLVIACVATILGARYVTWRGEVRDRFRAHYEALGENGPRWYGSFEGYVSHWESVR